MGKNLEDRKLEEWVEFRHLDIKPTPEEVLGYSNGFFMHMANSRSGHNYIRANIQSWTTEQPRKYYNFENIRPNMFSEKFKNVNLDNYPESIYVLQSRDLLNWFSSWMVFNMRSFLKRSLDRGIGWDDLIRINLDTWTAINKEMHGETNYLNRDFISINYDDFFTSEEYRRNICTRVGGTYNEDALLKITEDGRGSTTDGFRYEGRADEMKVLERYKQLPPAYKKTMATALKQHPEALNTYLKYYVLTTEQQDLINTF